MKVYEVHYDNGESWEDHYDCIECLYSTYDGAVKYLEERGTIAEKGWQGKLFWKFPLYVCSMNNIDCYDCEKYFDSDTYNGMTWVDEDGYETDECPESWERQLDSSDYSSYTIIEHEVRE